MDDRRLPPGPPLSAPEQMLAWRLDPCALLERTAETSGEVFTLHLGDERPYVVFAGPRAIRRILAAGPDELHADPGPTPVTAIVGEASVLNVNGPRQRQAHAQLGRALQGARARAYGRLLQHITRSVCASWAPGLPFTARAGMLEISRELAVRGLLGVAADHPALPRLRVLVRLLLHGVRAVAEGAPRSDLARILEELDGLLLAEIARRRRLRGRAPRHDLLERLMAPGGSAGASESDDRELRDHLITLFVHGLDPAATALSWALSLLCGTPRARRQLVRELDELGPYPGPDTLAARPYLGAVCDEVLRLRPPIPAVTRRVAGSLRIEGVALRPGDAVMIPIVLLHRREEFYPEPGRFVPERFVGREPSPRRFLPFGAGPRRCVGMGLVRHQMKIVLGTIMSEYELHSAATLPTLPVRRGLTVGPSQDALVRVQPRRRARATIAWSARPPHLVPAR